MAERHSMQRTRPTTSTCANDPGLLLVGHGTRDKRGLAEFQLTAHAVHERLPGVPLEASFLELAEPTIATGVRKLVDRGVRKLVVSPLMLFAAGHVKRDIPQAVSAAVNACGAELVVRHAPHLGCHEQLLRLAASRFAAATERIDNFEPHQTTLLLVGRGSRDEQAIAELQQFAGQLAVAVNAARVVTGFLAMARPSLSEALAIAAADDHCRHVIILPLLLFHGELLEQLIQSVREQDSRDRRRDWLVAEHLGPAREIVAAVTENFCQARRAISVATE